MLFAPMVLPGALLTAGHAYAQTSEVLFNVRATVTATCDLSATDLDLGALRPGTDVDVGTVIDLRCSPRTLLSVSLSIGNEDDITACRPGSALTCRIGRGGGPREPAGGSAATSLLADAGDFGPLADDPADPPAGGPSLPDGDRADVVRVAVTF